MDLFELPDITMNEKDSSSNNQNSSFISSSNQGIIFLEDSSWSSLKVFNTTGPNQQQITNGKGNPSASRETAVNGSLIIYTFMGNQINVLGVIQTGQSEVGATYSIDNGEPQYKSVPSGQGNSTANNLLFSSRSLDFGQHNIVIKVTTIGSERNYEFESFQVIQSNSQSSDASKNNGTKISGADKTKTTVAVVLCIIFGLILLFIAIYILWRKRLRKQASYRDSRRLRPMLYYADPNYRETRDKGSYYADSYIDTNSKFTFKIPTQPPASRSREPSWVTPSLPSSISQSVFVNSRLSDWSSYRGSNTGRDEEKVPQKSYFSPVTSTSLSTMGFREPPPPIPKKQMQVDTLTISTMSSQSTKKGRAL